uniref:Transposase n=1 Tax=Panagrellus redivivus TaxID=6233 RepID=A0A7E4V7Q6_PANRE
MQSRAVFADLVDLAELPSTTIGNEMPIWVRARGATIDDGLPHVRPRQLRRAVHVAVDLVVLRWLALTTRPFQLGQPPFQKSGQP